MMKLSHYIRHLFKLFTLIGITLMLPGCQILNKQRAVQLEQFDDQHQRQTTLATIEDWKVSGKLIFKSPKKKFSASLKWTQQKDKSDIRLTTFLGISIMKMLNDQYSATLQADGQTYRSSNPESLLYRTTGLTLPVNDLPQWMKGATPEYRNHSTVFDEQFRIKQIKLLDSANQQWTIDYQGYKAVGFHQLPQKIRLSGGDIVATIKISDWELNPSD